MFVAIFEAMFQVRLKGIARKPSHVQDYEHNAQAVIDALGTSILNMDLSHISGAAIVKGDASAIMNLVDIFVGISEVWLKRRFQNDALARTSRPLGLNGNAQKRKKKGGKAGVAPNSVRPKSARPGSARPGSARPGSASGSRPKTEVPELQIPADQERPTTSQSARAKSGKTGGELHESLASLATDYPKMWASLSERGTATSGKGAAEGGAEVDNGKPSR